MKTTIDFSKVVYDMKPVHGVNNGPQTCDFMRDATPLFKEIGIPYSRLHDTENSYGAGEFVDIPAVFRCFDADPEDPKSYNFDLTDHYIKAILDAGTKVIYRLGVTIENGPHKKYIYPPKDYRQWARICEGIIRHYTEGWADGMQNAVECFEIWNEPEFKNHMWMGTDEEFYKLFKDTIIYLKKRFPNVKIGGPGTGLSREGWADGFFSYLAEGERAPLDFFSFHTYFRNTRQIGDRMKEVKTMMEKYGYGDAKIFVTEWNHVNGWTHMEEEYARVSSHEGAAFVACALCEFQKYHYDAVTYYDAQMCANFNGLFKLAKFEGHDDIHGLAPKPSFFAMRFFGDLYRLGKEVYTECNGENGVSVMASTDGKTDGILIGRFDIKCDAERTVTLNIENQHGKTCEIHRYRVDKNEEEIETLDVLPNTITLPNYGFAEIILK